MTTLDQRNGSGQANDRQITGSFTAPSWVALPADQDRGWQGQLPVLAFARLAGDREPLSERGAQEGPGQFGETLGAGGAQCLPWGVGQPVGAPFGRP